MLHLIVVHRGLRWTFLKRGPRAVSRAARQRTNWVTDENLLGNCPRTCVINGKMMWTPWHIYKHTYYNSNTREYCIDSNFLIIRSPAKTWALGPGSRTGVKNRQYPPRTAGTGRFTVLSKDIPVSIARNPELEPEKCAKMVQFDAILGPKAYPVTTLGG